MPLNDDEPATDDSAANAAFQEFIAGERARTAAEQERRKQNLSQRVTVEDIIEIEQQQADEIGNDEPEEYDPWLDQLKNVERRAGIRRVYSADGVCELRISTRYILTTVLGVESTASNWSLASQRLSKAMRKLNWTGPKEMRFGRHKAHGYCRLDETQK